jgi:hypothetical protein
MVCASPRSPGRGLGLQPNAGCGLSKAAAVSERPHSTTPASHPLASGRSGDPQIAQITQRAFTQSHPGL